MASQLSQFDSTLTSLARNRPDLWMLSACGLTPAQEPIPSLLHRDAYSARSAGRRVLLIAGLSGSADDTMLALQVLKLVSSNSARLGSQIAISAIPNANPQAARDLSSTYPRKTVSSTMRKSRRNATCGGIFAGKPRTWCWRFVQVRR